MSPELQKYFVDLATGAAAAIVLSAAVQALPKPGPGGNSFYLWFYNFTQIVLANFDKARATRPAKPVVEE